MKTKTKEPDNVRTVQLWPSGQSVTYGGISPRFKVKEGGKWREATADERRGIRVEELADKFHREGVLCCDSSLLGDLLNLEGGDLGDEFSWENVQNLRPDSPVMDAHECFEYLDDRIHLDDMPEPNPAKMSRVEIIAALQAEGDGPVVATYASCSDADLRAKYFEAMDAETIDGLDEWRAAVDDQAEDAEVYEWWRVDSWLSEQLLAIGEVVLANAYGQWWGRCTTGQSMMMDGVFQKIANRFLCEYPDRD